MHMMALGNFVFATDTTNYQSISRKRDWRFDETDRFNARPATQFLGIGGDNITLSGTIWSGYFGRLSAIEDLAAIADTGGQHPLINSDGQSLGDFIIKSIGNDGSYLLDNGKPRKCDFTIELTRVS